MTLALGIFLICVGSIFTFVWTWATSEPRGLDDWKRQTYLDALAGVYEQAQNPAVRATVLACAQTFTKLYGDPDNDLEDQ